ncbi:MAG: murein biosynthesis integral membrane protein MurJ, partial [Ktedonobacteraceae bacterium]|nr:murein biosynthesis integral membrane protein MurJ [Ktedonobacteraceae bacterium]
MGNEAHQPPPPEPQGGGQQAPYGWQYDQDDATEVVRRPTPPPPAYGGRPIPPPPFPSQVPSSPLPPRLPQVPRSPLPSRMPQSPPPSELNAVWGGSGGSGQQSSYHEPIADMGSSLGYGQGMEYQYYDAPQPSQPIAQLRQERLQQLREERMRRQQQHLQPDASTTLRLGRRRPLQKPSIPGQTMPTLIPTGWLKRKSTVLPPQDVAAPPAQMSPQPGMSLRSQTMVDGLRPAAEPAQDTGLVQRVRVGKASLILTGAFLGSRVLGLIRSSMFAFVFGTSHISDAYVQAFLIPDFIFNIVAGGALSSAFIPVFTRYMVAEKDEKTAWHVASAALNLALAVMIVLALIAIIFANQLVPLYNPGIHDPAQLSLIATLSRIMFLQSIALGAGVIVTAVLNARQDFRLPAIGTVLYNVGLIGGLLPGLYFAVFTAHRNDTVAIYGATWGVVLGAALQVGIQIPGLFKVGMKYKPTAFDWRHPGVIQVARQMVPRIINSAMLYVSIYIDRVLIQLLGVVVGVAAIDGLITQYFQATQLMMLPLGVCMAVSTAAFPTLAENVARGRIDRVRSTILTTLRSLLFVSVPASAGLVVLGLPIIQVLLQHGRFDLEAAQSTAIPLAFFAFGLAGLAAVEILTRSFYAMRDSKTPVIVSIGQFVFKIALSVILVNLAVFGASWGMGMLAFSTSLAGLLEAVVLFWLI